MKLTAASAVTGITSDISLFYICRSACFLCLESEHQHSAFTFIDHFLPFLMEQLDAAPDIIITCDVFLNDLDL